MCMETNFENTAPLFRNKLKPKNEEMYPDSPEVFSKIFFCF